MSNSNKERNASKSLLKFHQENPDFASENVTKQWQIPGFKESRSGKNHYFSKPIVIFGVKYPLDYSNNCYNSYYLSIAILFLKRNNRER